MATKAEKRVLKKDVEEFIFNDIGGEITVTVEVNPEKLRTVRLKEGRDFEWRQIRTQVLVDVKKPGEADVEATVVVHYKVP